MSSISKKVANKLQRQHRVRASVTGTATRPRLSVNISNLHVSAQLIDDTAGKTLASASTVTLTMNGSRTQKAEKIGTEIAKAAKKLKISSVVFDRGSKLYHGRVSALADAARKEGLEF